MSAETWWGLVGVFLAAAVPWVEVVIAVPAGVVAGLPTIPVIIAGTLGNLATVAVAAYAGETLRVRLAIRRAGRASNRPEDPERAAHRAERTARRRERIDRIMRRGGLPLLALVGPLTVGTQVAAVLAIGAGASANRSFAWVGAGTVLWAVITGVLAATGSGLLPGR